MSVRISARDRRTFGRVPIGAAGEGEEPLFLEILFEDLETFGHQGERGIAIGMRFENLQHHRRAAQRDGGERQRHRGARRVARRDADGKQRIDRLRVAGNRDGASPAAAARRCA